MRIGITTTNETHPWSYVTHTFHNGSQRHDGDNKPFEGMISTFAIQKCTSVALNLNIGICHVYRTIYHLYLI